MPWSQARWNAEDWRIDAACRDQDPTRFFPIGTTGAAVEAIEAAKAVCAGCPVAQECLIFAVTTNQEYGVWGGLDEEERRGVRRQWRRASRQASRWLPATTG
jgi:WhiB family transcriptional regulator, redox-sensing transcriptional regulator